MPKYNGLFKVRGTIDDVNFYKSEDGFRMRRKGGVDGDRIKNDPSYERTRENNSEFGSSATSGKLLRRAIQDLVSNAKDSKLSSRLTQQMTKVKNEDLTSIRGQRNVATGIQTVEGKLHLKAFDFNRKSVLQEMLLRDFSLDTTTGEVVINDFIPSQHLVPPEGATHVTLTSGFLNFDFETNVKDLQLSNALNLPLNGTATTVTLTPAAPAAGTGQSFYFLKVAFFQEMNGIQYPLKNGSYNALQLIDVL